MLTRAAGAHTFLYRRTGGRIGRVIPGVRGRMLLLDHVGAKSGTLRTTPLLFVEDGEDLLLIASKGGFPKHPAWYHNLMANPDTTVQVGPERRPVHARVAAEPRARAPLGARRRRLRRLQGLPRPSRPRDPAGRARAPHRLSVPARRARLPFCLDH